MEMNQLTRRDAVRLLALGSVPLALGAGCATTPPALETPLTFVTSHDFGTLPDGRVVRHHLLRNRHGLTLGVMGYGATITEIRAPDRHGALANVLIGADTLAPYLQGLPAASVIGRYANRIRNARFTLDGREVKVTANAGPHHIHGGRQGFASKLWDAQLFTRGRTTGVTFTYRSADGEEGFPGNLEATTTYLLTDENEVVITYRATTDQPTVVNLTNHAYFNLAGTGDVLGHRLQIHATRHTPADQFLIPTGELAPVAGTPLDFTQPHLIGERIADIRGPSGYDHNYVLDGQAGTLRPAARVVEPGSGRVLECHTTEPGLQLYTANHFSGRPHPKHGAFCLETQHYPDSPNQPQFPSTVLRPDAPFVSETRFRFTVG